jgi:hypothetical protein
MCWLNLLKNSKHLAGSDVETSRLQFVSSCHLNSYKFKYLNCKFLVNWNDFLKTLLFQLFFLLITFSGVALKLFSVISRQVDSMKFNFFFLLENQRRLKKSLKNKKPRSGKINWKIIERMIEVGFRVNRKH